MTTHSFDQVLFDSLTHTRESVPVANPLIYETARQLGILRWLSGPTDSEKHHSLVDSVMADPTAYTPPDFQRPYFFPDEAKGEMIDIAIFSMEQLVDAFSFQERSIKPDDSYPNLYMARSRDYDHFVALEISADETGILHLLLSHPQKRLSLPIESVIDDPELQHAIATVHQGFIQRLINRHLPHRFWGTDGTIGLVTPTDRMTTYCQRLEQMLHHLVQQDTKPLASPGFRRVKTGDAARRLRRFQMTFDSKNMPRLFLQTVYGNNNRRQPTWEEMPVIEKAQHQDRFVDNGYLRINDSSLHIIVTTLDKFEDSPGAWELYLIHQENTFCIRLGRDYGVLDASPYSRSLGDIPDTRYDPVKLEAIVENWMDGFYVPGFIKILLQVVEHRDGYVTEESLREMLGEWMARGTVKD